MTQQFNARYRVTVYSNKETVIVEYPITCKFTVTRGVLSDSNKAIIQLYNLAPETRSQIFQDQFTLEQSKWKYVHLEAGYGNQPMPLIFKGRFLQAYSFKSGGQTDVITEIQATAIDIFDYQTSHTFAAGTTFKDAYTTMAADMPNVVVGNTGSLTGSFQTPTTFDGLVHEELNKLTGGHTFVDNGVLNTIMDNEVIDVPVPVISNNTNLLETPMRRDANLEIKTTFLPDIIAGQLVEVDSAVSPDFNGQFKLVGFTHDCLISPTQAGSRTTQMTLWIGPMLPASNIALTGGGVTGGAAPVDFNAVKGNEVYPVTPKPLQPKWIRPCNAAINSQYGYRYHPIYKKNLFHSGWDMLAPMRTPIKAVANGTVKKVVYDKNTVRSYGYNIEINHGVINGVNVTSFYAHLNQINVKFGQKVKQGDIIALSGGAVGTAGAGSSTGPHLHFEIRENGKPVNPGKYVK